MTERIIEILMDVASERGLEVSEDLISKIIDQERKLRSNNDFSRSEIIKIIEKNSDYKNLGTN